MEKDDYQRIRAELTRRAELLDKQIAEVAAKLHESEAAADDGVRDAVSTMKKYSGETELSREIVEALGENTEMLIEHIAMYVNDLEVARDFFLKYLGGHSNDGYHNKTTNFRSFFISFDDGARLEIMTKPELVDQDKSLNRTGYAHIAFSVGNKEKVDELTERLRTDGFEVVSGPRITGDGYYESCIVVIEGNQIEITI